jgi:uncharacterized protein YdaT
MPWTAKTFKKHWKGASSSQLTKAAAQASAMLKNGADEGVAIATAIKYAKSSSKGNKK